MTASRIFYFLWSLRGAKRRSNLINMARYARLASGLWILIILVGSLLPRETSGATGTGWHIFGYSVLAVLLAAWQPVVRAAVTAWTIGAVVELLQLLVAYRVAETGDLVANAFGVLVGLALRAGYLAFAR